MARGTESRLAAFTRNHAVALRPVTPLVEVLRRACALRYRKRHDRWTTIRDFDGDLRLTVDRASFIGSSIYWHGFYSTDELALLDRLLAPDATFVDVGANFGEFTLFAAKRLPRGRVVAFEPSPDLVERLRTHLGMNGLAPVATVVPTALSDRAARRTLYTSDDFMTDYGYNEGLGTLYRTRSRSRAVGTVRVGTLDDHVRRLDLERVDVLKIDVEGAELNVLQGAERTLRRHRPDLILEINDEAFRHAGYTTGNLTDFLQDHGYTIRRIGANGTLGRPDARGLPPFTNVYCTSPPAR